MIACTLGTWRNETPPFMTARTKALISWSSGKDAAMALHEVRTRMPEVEVVGLLTTISSTFRRVSMHGVREELLQAQAAALGLPCTTVEIPWPCTNEIYEREWCGALEQARDERGVEQVVFGDIFLRDVREYREAQLARTGLQGSFPLWQRETSALAQQMLEAGLRAVVTCLDPKVLPRSFAGRRFDAQWLAELPEGVDPCGENGEFHTLVTASPDFSEELHVHVGEVVERDGFLFADVLPA